MFRSNARSVGVLLSLLMALLMVGAVSAQEGPTFTTNPFADQTRGIVEQPTTIVNGVTFSSRSVLESQSRANVGLTHSKDNSNITPKNSIACNIRVNNVDQYTLENSYYRTFRLSDFSITKPLAISGIEAGIELARPANGAATQPVNVNLYVLTSSPTPSIHNLTPVGSARYDFPNVQNQFAFMPASALIFPDETLVVEINIPRGSGEGQFFYIGSNGGGETAPGYIRAPECGVNDMTTPAGVIPPRPTMHMLINVLGQTMDNQSFNVLTNGSFEVDFNGDNIPDNWKGKNLTGDKVVTDKPTKKLAFAGQRAFKFKGGAGEASKLVQKVDLNTYPTKPGDEMRFAAAFNAKNLPAGGIIKLKVVYVNPATPKTKLTFGVPTGTYAYENRGSGPMTLTDEVQKVKVIIQNSTPSGKFFLDATSMVWTAKATRQVRNSTLGGGDAALGLGDVQPLPLISGGAEVEALPLP